MSFGYTDSEWINPPDPPDGCHNCSHWIDTHIYVSTQGREVQFSEMWGICELKCEHDLGVECNPLDAIEWAIENSGPCVGGCEGWSKS